MNDIENKITKQNTWFQLESVIAVSVLLCAVTVSWASLNSKVSELSSRVTRLEGAYSAVDSKLDQILFRQSVDAELDAWRVRDLWTASMQQQFQDTWFEIIRKLHPEIDKTMIPDIRGIQRQEGRRQ